MKPIMPQYAATLFDLSRDLRTTLLKHRANGLLQYKVIHEHLLNLKLVKFAHHWSQGVHRVA